jgi:hypothetical protein
LIIKNAVDVEDAGKYVQVIYYTQMRPVKQRLDTLKIVGVVLLV